MNINDFSSNLESRRKQYIRQKIDEYKKQGFAHNEAINKANQSWRAHIGSQIQNVIYDFITENLSSTKLKVTTDKILKSKKLEKELEKVKRSIAISYGEYLFLPDADIIIYKKCKYDDIKILAIISIKNSFRERGFETTYWKLKLSESEITSHIKVFLATPDKDDEIAYIKKIKNPSKMRVILEYELDGLYFLKENFEETSKAKHFSKIIEDILEIAKEDC